MKHLGQIVELSVHRSASDPRVSLALVKTKASIRLLKVDFPERLLKRGKRAK